MTATDGSWTGSQPITLTYQWLRCSSPSISTCVPIAGATAKPYVVAQADLGLRLRVRVTASNAAGSATATSNGTSPAKKG